MQATGMYFVANSLFSAFDAMSRFLTWRFFMGGSMRPTGESVMPSHMESLIYAALLLIPAWVLLAKTDWCARAAADLSRPRDEEELIE
jgi:hypothetical protein